MWFRRFATCTGLMTVSTCQNATFDTMIAVYDGCDCDPQSLEANLLACNDDALCAIIGRSEVTVPVVENGCYLVRVGSPFGGQGTGQLDFTCEETIGCDGDVVGFDGVVNVLDLLGLLGAWGSTNPQFDVTGDNFVDVQDLLFILANWGPCT